MKTFHFVNGVLIHHTILSSNKMEKQEKRKYKGIEYGSMEKGYFAKEMGIEIKRGLKRGMKTYQECKKNWNEKKSTDLEIKERKKVKSWWKRKKQKKLTSGNPWKTIEILQNVLNSFAFTSKKIPNTPHFTFL